MTSPPKPADLALRDVCTRHLLYCENRLKPNTLSYKTTAYRRFIAFAGGDTSFRSITKHAIDKFVDELARIISKKTANKHKTELSSLWAWANKEGLVQGNPPQQIDSYAVKKTVKYIPPSVDIAKLLNIADEGFEKDFLVCLLHTAARISEIRNMAWEDVDLPHRTVTLWTSKRRGGNSEPRKIAMSETLYELLEKLNGQRTGAEAYVFTDPKTGTAYTRTCNKIKFFMGNLCARAGVLIFPPTACATSWPRTLTTRTGRKKCSDTRTCGQLKSTCTSLVWTGKLRMFLSQSPMKSPMAKAPPMKKGLTFYSKPLKFMAERGTAKNTP